MTGSVSQRFAAVTATTARGGADVAKAAAPMLRAARNLALIVVGLWLLERNLWWLGSAFRYAAAGMPNHDWSILANLDPTNPYTNGAFHWSVPAAWAWRFLVQPIGFLGWVALHFAALATIRDWRLVAAVLLTFPFWADTLNGNVLTFAFVAAYHALQGSRAGVVAFCVLAALVPRPLMLPVLAWLLWHRADARWTFAAAAAIVLAAALATGTLGTWLHYLSGTAGNEYAQVWNVGPSRLLGAAWVPVGLALAAILTWKGRLGLASLAASPYLIHYYVIMGLLELRRSPRLPERPGCHSAPTSTAQSS